MIAILDEKLHLLHEEFDSEIEDTALLLSFYGYNVKTDNEDCFIESAKYFMREQYLSDFLMDGGTGIILSQEELETIKNYKL